MKSAKILLFNKLISKNIAFEFEPHGSFTIGSHKVVFYRGFIYFDDDMSCSDNNKNVEKIFDEFIQYVLLGDKDRFETVLEKCIDSYKCAFCGSRHNFWKDSISTLISVEDGSIIGSICPNCHKAVSPYALYKKTGGIPRSAFNSQVGEDLITYARIKRILE